MQIRQLTKEDLLAARQRLHPFLKVTPLLTDSSLDRLLAASLFFKSQPFQITGSFKARGAYNAVLKNKDKGIVCTHSSGNHGQALASAATRFNLVSRIVMPFDSAKSKIRAVKINQGGDQKLPESIKPGDIIENPHGSIIFSQATEASRTACCEKEKEKGAYLISAYDDYDIIQGQSTAAQQIFQQLNNELDVLIVPIGGGGLMAGTLLARNYFAEHVQVIGVQPERAGQCAESLKKGERVGQYPPVSIADGLRIGVGRRNFQIIRKNLKQIILVSEEEIVEATRLVWEKLKVLAEPSCTITLAGALKLGEGLRGKRVGLVLTGGNGEVQVLVKALQDKIK